MMPHRPRSTATLTPGMRRAVLSLATATLLFGSTVIAFSAGGYFEWARLPAGLVTWTVVLVTAVALRRPLPRSTGGWLAVIGLGGLLAWTALSLHWAPLSVTAVESIQLLVLYVGVLLAAIALLRQRAAARAVEPALALGVFVVIAYGLLERVLPTVFSFQHVFGGAEGRLDQPLTYWNAEGLLAALGLVLATRLVGDGSRPAPMRLAAAAALAPIGAGVYLSYSRGAIAAAGTGLLLLVVLSPTRSQLWAALGGAAAVVAAALLTVVLPEIASVDGTLTARRTDGAIALVVLVVLMAGAALLARRLVRREARRAGDQGHLPVPAHIWVPATLVAVLVAVGLVAAGLGERKSLSPDDASRLTSLSSSRYDYWRVGAEAFADHPWRGLGAGGYRVAWTEKRPILQGTRNAHSLELEIAAELGLPGLAALLALLVGVGLAGREAFRRDAVLSAGPIAACAVWLLHATIDWDWQMPAVTMPALVLAGALVAAGEATREHDAPTEQADGRAAPAAPPDRDRALAGGATRAG